MTSTNGIDDSSRQNQMAEKTSLEVAPEDTRPTTAVEDTNATEAGKALGGKVDFGFLPIPPRLRYNPERKVHFGVVLNAIFGFASTFGASCSSFLRECCN